MKKNMNIMTACDESYAKYILPQLASIKESLSEYRVNFFLLYSRISQETIQLIESFTDTIKCIDFYPCYIDANIDKNIEAYNLIASSGGGGTSGKSTYPYEIYFWLNCQNYLPKTIDRVLYIHSADIIFLGDISKFYFSTFNGKLLTVELTSSKAVKEKKDGIPILYKSEDRAKFIKSRKINYNYFNSGSIMINVEKFRKKIDQ